MKKKQWEPETLYAYMYEDAYGDLQKEAFRTHASGGMVRYQPIQGRFIREKDYQKLLRLARKTPKRT